MERLTNELIARCNFHLAAVGMVWRAVRPLGTTTGFVI